MIINNTDIMPDASEIVHYDEVGLPLYIRKGILSAYPSYRAAAHWHEDLEFIGIIEGEMNYSINGEIVLLGRGDTLFVNSRQIHYGFDQHLEDCIFYCFLVHPSILYGDSMILRDLIYPMLSDSSFPYRIFPQGTKEADKAQKLLESIYQLKQEKTRGYDFSALGKLSELVGMILDSWAEKEGRKTSLASQDPQLELQRRMVAYVEEHYTAELSLDEIAGSAAVSRSTCCRLFRKYVHTSPLEFLNSYRLQKSCDMLRTTDLSVTDIALRCGFNHPSYYSHLFERYYGCRPREYRKQQALVREKNRQKQISAL